MSDAPTLLSSLGVPTSATADGDLAIHSPIDGRRIGLVKSDSPAAIDAKIARADAAFQQWRSVPAPRRGELVRLLGEELRGAKEPLGRLVTLENGKILEEGRGEVQEMIDICDFAVGLSRQLYGLTIASERPGHRMMETWHPLSAVGVITAFNFPVAVWSWNAAIALVCGDPVVWKPSEKTPLTALACKALLERAAKQLGGVPDGLLEVIIGARAAGERIAADARLRLVSATGSTRMGKALAPTVAARLGRCLLELGGNNGAIVAGSADLDLVVRAVSFAAVGTAGQRCTSLRRLIVHESIKTPLLERLQKAYGSIRGGERVLAERSPDAYYVKPAIVDMPNQTAIVREETFAPILYVMGYRTLEDALRLHNEVPQGLASSVFTNDLREAESFMGAAGSDCGIVNVNIGPSGAEIGGAFGGEKETGGGREAGSDVWKSYMRRVTSTINFGRELPLAQGIRFHIN